MKEPVAYGNPEIDYMLPQHDDGFVVLLEDAREWRRAAVAEAIDAFRLIAAVKVAEGRLEAAKKLVADLKRNAPGNFAVFSEYDAGYKAGSSDTASIDLRAATDAVGDAHQELTAARRAVADWADEDDSVAAQVIGALGAL